MLIPVHDIDAKICLQEHVKKLKDRRLEFQRSHKRGNHLAVVLGFAIILHFGKNEVVRTILFS